jgi:hypothetical protein
LTIHKEVSYRNQNAQSYIIFDKQKAAIAAEIRLL